MAVEFKDAELAGRERRDTLEARVCKGSPILSIHPNETLVAQVDFNFIPHGQHAGHSRIGLAILHQESSRGELCETLRSANDKLCLLLALRPRHLSLTSNAPLPL